MQPDWHWVVVSQRGQSHINCPEWVWATVLKFVSYQKNKPNIKLVAVKSHLPHKEAVFPTLFPFVLFQTRVLSTFTVGNINQARTGCMCVYSWLNNLLYQQSTMKKQRTADAG